MSHSRNIDFVLFVVCVVLLLSLAGCRGEGVTEEVRGATKPRIGILLYRADDVYIAAVSRALEKSFEGKADVFFVDGKNEQYVQDEQLGTILAEGVDALAVNLVDVQAASCVVDRIQKANVPVVFFNREPSLDDVKDYSRACFVGTVPQDAGLMQGEIIHQLWAAHPEFDRNKDGIFQYVMLQATSDNPEALARTQYSVHRARELGVRMEQVGNTFMGGWDEERSYALVRPVLPHIIDSMEIIIANSDAMALGAIRALQELGYNTAEEGGKYIPVVGVDATEQGMHAIASGIMAGTVKQDSELMGKVIATLLLNAVHEKPLLDGLDLGWDESGIALRLPYCLVGEE